MPPGQSVTGSGAQIEHQVLPNRLHLIYAAAVRALVGDVGHWAPARTNGLPSAGGQTCKNSGPLRSRDVSPLCLPGSGATPRQYAATASLDRGSRQIGAADADPSSCAETPHLRSDRTHSAARVGCSPFSVGRCRLLCRRPPEWRPQVRRRGWILRVAPLRRLPGEPAAGSPAGRGRHGRPWSGEPC
jgi:hypothetical protein